MIDVWNLSKTYRYEFISRFGPNSVQVREKVEDLDADIGYLLNKLEDAGLIDNINIIITSDHGVLTKHSKYMYMYIHYIHDIQYMHYIQYIQKNNT